MFLSLKDHLILDYAHLQCSAATSRCVRLYIGFKAIIMNVDATASKTQRLLGMFKYKEK